MVVRARIFMGRHECKDEPFVIARMKATIDVS